MTKPPVAPVEGHYALLRNGMVIMKMFDTYDPHRGPRTDADLWTGHPDYDWSVLCWRPDGSEWSGDGQYDIIATISPADMQAAANGEIECGKTLCKRVHVSPLRNTGVHHKADVDAEMQAIAICQTYKKLRIAE